NRGRERIVCADRRRRADEYDAAPETEAHQAREQRIGGAAQTEIDDLHAGVDRGRQRFRERERIARCAGTCLAPAPAGAERVQARSRCDADDTQPVVVDRAYDARYGRAVEVYSRTGALRTHEIAIVLDATGQVGMVDIDAGVDDAEAHALSSRRAMRRTDIHR